MKYSLTTLLLALCGVASAQCIVLRVGLNECATCRTTMAYCNPSDTRLPAYAVFPNSRKADSADLEYAARFGAYGVHLIFNDRWFARLNNGGLPTMIAGLDRNGEVVFKGDLRQFPEQEFKQFVEANQPDTNAHPYEIVIERDSFNYRMDLELGVLRINNRYTGMQINAVRSSELALSEIANRLKEPERANLKEHGTEVSNLSSAYVGRYVSFSITPSGYIALLYQYSVPSLTLPKQQILDKHCYVMLDRLGNRKAVLPIYYPETLVFYDPFALHCDTVSYHYTWELAEGKSGVTPGKDIHYIAKFIRKEDSFVFDRILPISRPRIYSDKYGFNNLNSFYGEYNFAWSYLDDVITDVQSLRTTSTLKDAGLQPQIRKGVSRGGADEYFHAQPLRTNLRKKRIYAGLKADSVTALNVYDLDLKLLHTSRIATAFIPGATLSWLNLHPDANLMEMHLTTATPHTYWLPLDLFTGGE